MKPNLIALSIDTDMFPAAAFVADKLASLNKRNDVDIAILSDSQDDLAKARDFGVPANLIAAKLPIELEGRISKRLSVAAFLRLFIVDFVSDAVRRILYLDADVYPEDDRLFSLFDLDMDDHSVAGVRDINVLFTRERPLIEKDLATARVKSDEYLNGGVLLLDRRRFLSAKIGERAFRLALKQQLRVDLAVNRILRGDWLELSPAMNTPIKLRDLLSSAGYAPALTHFIGEVKPWYGPRFAVDHPARREIESYLVRSPWRGFLSRHYSFRSAWESIQAKQGGPTHAAPPSQATAAPGEHFQPQALYDYLRNTEFADVRQGITRPSR